MRILLIDPPGWQEGLNVGLAFLASPLMADGHTVQILDLNNHRIGIDEFAARVQDFAPDVIGFSVKTATSMNCSVLSLRAREVAPKAVQIAGGPHVTLFPERFLRRNPQIQYAFLGEVEHLLPVFLRELVSETGLVEASGYACLKEDAFHQVPSKQKIELDELMLPNFEPFTPDCSEQLRRQYPLVTSRGCPYRCTFCSVPFISGRKWRKRSAASLIQEINAARERYGVQHVQVIDDNFTLNLKHAKETCRTFLEAKLDIAWSCPNGVRADRLDEELVDLMAQAGCKHVMLGIESSEEPVFDRVDKGEKLQDIINAIRLLKSRKLSVGGFFIIGLPGENKHSVKKNYEFVKRMGLDVAHFNIYVPYPGTPGWNWAKEETTLLRDFEEGFHFTHEPKVVFETPEFSAKEKLEAYRWVNTRLGSIALIIPSDAPAWKRHLMWLGLVLRYDPFRLPLRAWQLVEMKLKNEFRKLGLLLRRLGVPSAGEGALLRRR